MAPFGIAQQALDRGSNLGLHMIFQHVGLARRQQFAALRNFFDDAQLDQVGPLGPVLMDDGDDQPIIGGIGLCLVPERSRRSQELEMVARSLILDAVPVAILCIDLLQALIGAPGYIERRLDGPRSEQLRSRRARPARNSSDWA